MQPGVYTIGDPDKLLWVISAVPNSESWLCLAGAGKVKNRLVIKAFITKLTANTRRVLVDPEDAQDFKKKCTHIIVELLNDKAVRPTVRREMLKAWTQVLDTRNG